MKKALVILLFLFLLSGCKSKEYLLGISRIDESSVCEEYCLLDLKVISTEAIDNIQVDNLYTESIYDYQVLDTNKEVKLNNDVEKKIYSYDLKIKLYQPTQIKNIDLKIDDKRYTFDIGLFQCLSKDEVLKDKEAHLKCSIEKFDDCHKVNLENTTDRPILITDIGVIEKEEKIKVCPRVDKDIIKAVGKEYMAYTYFDMDNIYKMNYLLQVDYTYNGEVYTTYFEINDDNTLESVSNIGSYILVDESCFVKGS